MLFSFSLTRGISRIVVIQSYETDVIKEFAIRGNVAIMKCQVPSYVADFTYVVSWLTDKGEEFQAGRDYGKKKIKNERSSRELI